MHHIKPKEFLIALVLLVFGIGALYVVLTTQKSSSDIRAKASNQTSIKVSGTVQSVDGKEESFTLPIDQVDNATEAVAQPLVSALQGKTWKVKFNEDVSKNETECFQGSQKTIVLCSQLVQVGKKVQVHTVPGDIRLGPRVIKAHKIYDRSQ